MAKSLFCTDKVGVLPCEKCRNCKLIEQEEFPDVTLIKPVNQVIKTERIRELVGQFSQAGIESQQQVFIIEQAEKMHPNAANSLLKVIEEPQSEVYIFFLTSDEEKSCQQSVVGPRFSILKARRKAHPSIRTSRSGQEKSNSLSPVLSITC